MNRSVLYSVIIVVLISMTANHATGQPERLFPNPAYMIWEQPCLESYALYMSSHLDHCWKFPNSLSNYFGSAIDTHLCYVNPFRSESGKLTIYGVALCMTTRPYYPITLPLDRVTIDVSLYNFTPGDSNVQLIISQSFVVEQNQPPDLIMLYKSLHNCRYPGVPDSMLRLPMYEFYFDSPVDLSGDFYVGIHSEDTISVATGSLLEGEDEMILDRSDGSCCPSGYYGCVDMERSVLTYWNAECDWEIGQSWYTERMGKGIIAPQTDTLFTYRAPAVMPILRPQGYLSAAAPTAEMGKVRLQPNPARTHVVVEAECAIKHVELADMSGRVLLSERYDGQAQSVTLDVSRLAKGSYVVKVKTERDESAQKLLVE